jgi:hypothetical protein
MQLIHKLRYKYIMLKHFLLLIFPLLFACTHVQKNTEDNRKDLTIFIYAQDFFRAADKGESALETQFEEIFKRTGKEGVGGKVGIALVFPYLNWTKGTGKGLILSPIKF